MADMKFASIGYVVERWMNQKDIEEAKAEYIKIKENIGEEKWNELSEVSDIMQKFIDDKIEPHFFGIKGGQQYSWAKSYKEEQERITKEKHRVVKAGFPSKDMWTGYTILDWN